MYEQSERCNFKTIFSISSCIRVFSASLPAIASGEKPSAKRSVFDMVFFQRTSTDSISVRISLKQNQPLLLMISAQSVSNQYEYTGMLLEISIKQNQSFPWMKLLHDLRAINNTTSNLPRICMKCVTRNRDKEPWWAFHTDALQKANHKSGGKSSTIGCHKVTNQGAEQKNKN